MLTESYIPGKMKVGVIITICKGGSKPRDDPNSYRAITLMSSILKLNERILYNRLLNTLENPLNPLEGGFQKNMGCNMTSYLVQEIVNYAKENNSKLYVCFLDAKQAFDHVWHDGLFFKLHELGINLYIWKAIVSLHEKLTSYVFSRGFKSPIFYVLQGTRQGGVISPIFYLCYITDLLNILCSPGFGLRIDTINITCPTVADDMVLISLTKFGLQFLMNFCYLYAGMWRFL